MVRTWCTAVQLASTKPREMGNISRILTWDGYSRASSPGHQDKKSDMLEVHDLSESESNSEMDTDLCESYVMKQRSSQLRHVLDTGCPSCDFTAVWGINLYHHIKDLHPQMREYQCWDCDKQFNTDHDRLNHMNSVHCKSVYQCTVCSFSAPVESQIQLHVCTHSARSMHAEFVMRS